MCGSCMTKVLFKNTSANMKFLFLLWLICLISANPIIPAAKLPENFRIGPDDVILRQLVHIALNITKGSAYSALENKDEPFLERRLGCVTGEIRGLMQICYNRVLDAIVMSKILSECNRFDPVDQQEANNNKNDKSGDETKPDNDFLSNQQLPLPIIGECVLAGIEALDIAQGRINLTIVREKIINDTKLAAPEKEKANFEFDQCAFSNFTLPRTLDFGIKENALPQPLFKLHMLEMKTLMCSVKALLNHGCAAIQRDSYGRSVTLMQTSVSPASVTLPNVDTPMSVTTTPIVESTPAGDSPPSKTTS